MTLVKNRVGFRVVAALWFIAALYSCCRTAKPAASAQVATIVTDFRTLTIRMEELRCR